MFEDHGSTRINLACPHCHQRFKVRLRKLQFGADLTCRLCRHEFSTREVSERPEVQDALARMHRIVQERTNQEGLGHLIGIAASSPARQWKPVEHPDDAPRLTTAQQTRG